LATGGDVGDEVTDLAVLDFAQVAAPLAGDAAGVVALLGHAVAIDDEDGLGMGQFLTDVRQQLGADGVVVPLAGADEVLQGTAFLLGLARDGLGRLALEAGELALEDGGGMVALFVAVEEGQVTLEEGSQTTCQVMDIGRGDGGLGEELLSCGVFQDGGHANPPSGSAEGIRAGRGVIGSDKLAQ
jgi:hypothetical protein